MKSTGLVKIVLVIVLFGTAGFGFFRFFHKKSDISEQAYFYDLSEKKLFAASREALPPIKGINDKEEDAVRAVVICTAGNPEDPKNRTIAYLEKYGPELKANLEEVRTGKAEPLERKARNGFRFVKRPQDEQWYAANSPEGEKILNGWNVAGADGKYPIVCSP